MSQSELEVIVKEFKELKEGITKAVDDLIKKNIELEKKVETLEKMIDIERTMRRAQARILKRMVSRSATLKKLELKKTRMNDIKLYKNEDVRKKLEELKKKLEEKKNKSVETPRPMNEIKHPSVGSDRDELIRKILKGEIKIEDVMKQIRG
ncbi:MAG: hypothetical protein QW607_10290 [Desulfurococcaceae archaeon]